MRIIVDAMGSDHRPVPDVGGAIKAARQWPEDDIVLIGPREIVEAEVGKHQSVPGNLYIEHATDVITMTDKPADSARSKVHSSMHIGMGMVRDHKADAFVSAGNTGAALAVATLMTLRRIRGVQRPALCAIFPNLTGHAIMCDFGANTECKPEHLVQFALMAITYTELALRVERPRVALLSNGEEEGKGSSLVLEAFPLMEQQTGMNFIGNVEPKGVMLGGTDIVIHDGFSGNVMGKTLEATAIMMGRMIEREIKRGPTTILGGLLSRPALQRVRNTLHPDPIGGVPLLGVNGVVIIGHGSSSDIAIYNAIRQAREAVAVRLVDAIRERINQVAG